MKTVDQSRSDAEVHPLCSASTLRTLARHLGDAFAFSDLVCFYFSFGVLLFHIDLNFNETQQNKIDIVTAIQKATLRSDVSSKFAATMELFVCANGAFVHGRQ